MFCPACGEAIDADARFCDRCRTDLARGANGTASKGPPANAGSPAPSSNAPKAPLLVFAPVRPRAWWYPIGVWVLLSAFFLFVDLATGGGVEWSYWPIGLLGIFMLGFPLLNLLEAWTARARAKR